MARAQRDGSSSPRPMGQRWHGVVVGVAVVAAMATAAPAPAGASPTTDAIQSRACRSCVAQGVTAITAKDAWIVGFRGGPGSYLTWVRQWNGKHWHNLVAPSPGSSNELFGVDGTSSTDAWTVGWYYESHLAKSLIEHWDGTSWTWVPGPLTGTAPLFDVSTVSPSDAWAVGNYVSDVGQRTLITHWDGSSWSQVPSPNPAGATNITLRKVSAVSSTDAWALGQYRVPASGLRSYLLHWDGATWTEVPTVTQNLQDVSADTTSDAWTVGAENGGDATVTERWNGTEWSRIASPNPGGGPAHVLTSVDARTGTDAWAVGYVDEQLTNAAMILHWDGTAWTESTAPAPQNSYLYAVSASTATDAWAIGDATGSGKSHLLLLHWDGVSWTEG